ncbi:3832_t:CDS:1, partial [Racocetra persica]
AQTDFIFMEAFFIAELRLLEKEEGNLEEDEYISQKEFTESIDENITKLEAAKSKTVNALDILRVLKGLAERKNGLFFMSELEEKKLHNDDLGKLGVAMMLIDEKKNTHLELLKKEKILMASHMATIIFSIANFIEELQASENAKKKKDIAEEFVTKQELITLVKEAEKEVEKVGKQSLVKIDTVIEYLKNDSLVEFIEKDEKNIKKEHFGKLIYLIEQWKEYIKFGKYGT